MESWIAKQKKKKREGKLVKFELINPIHIRMKESWMVEELKREFKWKKKKKTDEWYRVLGGFVAKGYLYWKKKKKKVKRENSLAFFSCEAACALSSGVAPLTSFPWNHTLYLGTKSQLL